MTTNNTSLIQAYATKIRIAKKTKNLFATNVVGAKALGIVDDKNVVQTLEGPITVTDDAVICKGAAGEHWPQTEKKLLAKYSATGQFYIAGKDTRWSEYTPKPDKEVQAFQVTDRDTFTVDALWGLLNGKRGDYVCIDPTNTEDVWIVAKNLFESTYEFAD